MARLLQGDVGCGKTVVAIASALYVAENGMQTRVAALACDFVNDPLPEGADVEAYSLTRLDPDVMRDCRR